MSLFLSGAMVVAFAPAVAAPLAEAKIGAGSVEVTFDGGLGKPAPSGLDKEAGTVNEDGILKLAADSKGLASGDTGYGRYTYNNASFDHWFYDADGDKVDTSAEEGSKDVRYVTDADVTAAAALDPSVTLTEGLDTTGIAAGTASVKLTAAYKTPEVTEVSGFAVNSSLDDWGNTAEPNVAVTVKAKNLSNKASYNAVASFGDTAIATSNPVTGAGEDAVSTFTLDVPKSAIKAGEYTFKIVSGTTDVAGALQTAKVVTVTFESGDYGKLSDGNSKKEFLVSDSVAYSTIVPPTVAGGAAWDEYGFIGFALADGTVPENGVTFSTDTVLTARYNNPQVASLTFDETANSNKGGLSYALAGLPLEDSKGNAVQKWTVSIEGVGDAFDVDAVAVTDDSSKFAGTAGYAGTYLFDNGFDTDQGTKSKVAGGTYKLTATAKYANNVTNGQAISVTKSVNVVAVTYDVGDATTERGWDNSLVKFFQAGKTLEQAGVTQPAAVPAALNKVTPADATLGFGGWSVDGATKADLSKVSTKETDTSVTLKALWVTAAVAAPTLNAPVKNADGTYTLTFAEATAGATLTYAINGTPYGSVPAAGITVKDTQTPIVVTATPVSGSSLNPGTLTVKSFKDADVTARFDEFAAAALGEPTAASTKEKVELYSTVLSDAKKAGDDALEAIAFASAADFAKEVVVQKRTVLASIADSAKGVLAAKKAGEANSDGSIKRISDDAYAKAVADIDEVLADFDAINDDDNKTKPSDNWRFDENSSGEDYSSTITLIVLGAAEVAVDVPKAVTDVEALIAAIPAEPAADADDATKKAFADAVKAAEDAYAALPEADQAKVSAASVAALYKKSAVQAKADLDAAVAQAKADAADPAKNEALKEAQDNYAAAQKKVTAAVKATKPAVTVKAGKKKLTVKAAKGTLEKLGKVTYKYRVKKGTKAGGTWKALKAGKTVTVKKLAKGKKYTVQVKATVDGTAAKTFKKTVKVK